MFRVKTLALVGSAVVAAMSASAANATVYMFDLSGSKSASFSIDTAIPPAFTSASSLIGNQISYSNVAGTFGGIVGTAPSVGFGTGLVAGFQISGTSLGFAQFASADLFSGPLTSPVFNLGTFSLSSIVAGASTLRISQATTGAVPEPATWMMMLAGFALTGAAIRRRRPLLATA